MQSTVLVLVLIIFYIRTIAPENQTQMNSIERFPDRSQNGSNETNTREKKDIYAKLYVFLFMSTMLTGGILVHVVMQVLHIPIPYRVLLLVAGIVCGILSHSFVTMKKYTAIADSSPRTILTAVLPVLVFKTAFSIDAHMFMKSWSQIFLISVPGFLMHACITGFTMTAIINRGWTWPMSVLFGILCSPIYPAEVITVLRELGESKHTGILLEGEGLLVDAVAVILCEIIIGILEEFITKWYQMILVFLRFAVGGLIIGYIFGKLTNCVVSHMIQDSLSIVVLTISVSYLTYYVAEYVLFVSGILAVLVLGIIMNEGKAALTSDVESCLNNFWEVAVFVANTLIFVIVGVIVTQHVGTEYSYFEYTSVLIAYIVTIVARFLMFISFAPILSRIGYGLTWPKVIITVWGCLRGALAMCLALIVIYRTTYIDLGVKILFHVAGITLMSLLINATTMMYVLRALGLTEISIAKKANMNNCVRYVRNRRDRMISTLKMDRFLSDANWTVVEKATYLKHPYKIEIDDNDTENDYYLGYRLTNCPDCQRLIVTDPTTKEKVEIVREARLRILKAKRISYVRQYEHGLVSQEAIRVLTQSIETSMDTKSDTLVELRGLLVLYVHKGFVHILRNWLQKITSTRTKKEIKPPRKPCRRACYSIVMSNEFEIFIYIAIALSVIPVALELHYQPDYLSTMDVSIFILNTVFFVIYWAEFLLKVFAYSYIYIQQGLKTYFRSYWNRFDFFVLMVVTVDFTFGIHKLVGSSAKHDFTYPSRIMTALKLLRILRLLRLCKLMQFTIPRTIQFFESRIDKKLGFAYDIGKGFVKGEEEVSETLDQMIDNVPIRMQMKRIMDSDRLEITKQLGMIQKNRPCIAITVKTRQAIKSILYGMREAVLELKNCGWLDDVEYGKIKKVLNERMKHARGKERMIEPCPPSVIFKEVPWMAGEDNICEFLYENVITKVFDPGDIVVAPGQKIDGIYIVVTGLFKVIYEPTKKYLDEMADYGALPVMDYITAPRLQEHAEDYIVSGNVFGELGVLSDRPYCSTIIADTPSQVYVLTANVVREALKIANDTNQGLECRLWKSISIPIATSLLMESPAYLSWNQEKIHFQLERSFCPVLNMYKIFMVNEMIEDIVLIEGLMVDFNTRDLYTAPCYIPRTVQKLILPRSSTVNITTTIETKILIIPTKDVESYEIMEREEEISEVVSTASAKCLQHIVQNKMQNPLLLRKRRRRNQTNFGVYRKVVLGESQSSYLQKSIMSSVGSLLQSYHEKELQTIKINDDKSDKSDKSDLTNQSSKESTTNDERLSIADQLELVANNAKSESVEPKKTDVRRKKWLPPGYTEDEMRPILLGEKRSPPNVQYYTDAKLEERRSVSCFMKKEKSSREMRTVEPKRETEQIRMIEPIVEEQEGETSATNLNK